ncbi:hypothetical protein AWM75_05035 [Aerococcus urinaehominis]|uniref:N-acetyltransferase domain-containing protein n=1 Tax=Aerococcus urinaehominis TaxID=128944 RepID=A0A0X8FLB0_9LACT|nr:ribosomal protein S18-alanine N-acetyltransferase [Aerococcus urinaehominis]AMB99395.1 hypothetical protein AWM75_05035 [Aerococcus urinaehominis]
MKEPINYLFSYLRSLWLFDNFDQDVTQKIRVAADHLQLAGHCFSIHISDISLCSAMVELELAAYQGKKAWDYQDFLFDIKDNPNSFYLQVCQADRLVAFIGCRRDASDVHISNFMTHPEYQGLGIGRYLLNQLARISQDLDRQQISLEVRQSNHQARDFYLNRGFKIIRLVSGYYRDNGEDAYYMVWDLVGSQDAEH